MSESNRCTRCNGGDNAPVEIVKGAVEAVKEEAGLLVKLVGREEQVRAELAKYTYPQGQIEVVDAPDVIETGEQPVMAIRRKKILPWYVR